ncbi:MAG TPA: PLDc N-terminal domain-containing protein [Pseudonocardiaceae bacterium]|jgi:hypothetical protein|nr:PLDc N-terminal domain-containing protein [Pseudonocardiaceae bacterium]
MAQQKPKTPLIVVLVLHAVITILTWRDLRRRPAESVRGNKTVWRVVATANTLGSLAYLLFGRRRTPAG